MARVERRYVVAVALPILAVAGCGGGSNCPDARPPVDSPAAIDSSMFPDAGSPDASAPDAAPTASIEYKVCLDGVTAEGTSVPVDPMATLSNVTIEFWFKSTAPPSTDWIDLVYLHPAAYVGGNYPAVAIGIADAATLNMGPLSGRTIEVGVDARGGPQDQLNSRGFDLDATLADFDEHQWHHYAVVWDGTTQRVFVDGTELLSTYQRDGSQATTFASAFGPTFTTVYGSLYLSLGYFARDNIRYAQGAMSDVRVSDTARYSSNFTPAFRAGADSDTIMLLPLNQATGAVAPDTSSSSYDVTWSGGFSWSGLLLGCPG